MIGISRSISPRRAAAAAMVFVPGMDLSLKVPVLGEVCLLNAVWLPFAIPALHFALRLKLRPLAAVSLVTALAHGVARYTSLFWSGYRLGNEIDAWFAASVLPARRWLPREICMWFMPPHPPTSNISFVSALRNGPPPSARLDEATRLAALRATVNVCLGRSVHLLYSYASIRPAMPELRVSLRNAIAAHFGARALARDVGTAVIHYRLGDFLSGPAARRLGRSVLTPAHLLLAMRSIPADRYPSRLVLLSGGPAQTRRGAGRTSRAPPACPRAQSRDGPESAQAGSGSAQSPSRLPCSRRAPVAEGCPARRSAYSSSRSHAPRATR